MKLYLTCGIPASGKSTWTSKFLQNNPNTIVICPDDIREELTGDASDQSKNKEVWELAYERLNTALCRKLDVLFDSTMVDEVSRKFPLEISKKYKAETIAVAFPVGLETALKRNAGRDRKVPEDVIRKFYERFVFPDESEGFDNVIVVEEDKPKKELRPFEEIVIMLMDLRDELWEKHQGKPITCPEVAICLKINSCLYKKN
jgi:predicted kinase